MSAQGSAHNYSKNALRDFQVWQQESEDRLVLQGRREIQPNQLPGPSRRTPNRQSRDGPMGLQLSSPTSGFYTRWRYKVELIVVVHKNS